jgi:putative lipoprotein (rSAM/lipoprotein system)
MVPMKILKKHFYRCSALFLSFMGFMSPYCSDGKNDNNASSEYGPFYTYYDISGTVVDENGIAIAGIQIAYDDISVLSDSKGEWEINGKVYSMAENLIVSDVDGALNGGTFAGQEISINPTETSGVYEESGITITLTEASEKE